MEHTKPTMIDHLAILINWRKFIIKVFLYVSILAVIYSLMMPKTFESSATILPPTQDDSLGLSSLLGSMNLPIAGLLGGALSPELNLFLAIVNSRNMMKNVINRFSLQERYAAKDIEKTMKQLRENIDINVEEEGTITVSARAETPFLPNEEDENEARKLSRDMANYIISELDKTNIKFKTEKAKNNRLFIERRYNQNIQELTDAELALNTFQKEYGAIDLPTQAKQGITAAANLKAEIIATEIEVNVLKEFFSTNHVTYQQTVTKLRELEKKYSEFQMGSSTNGHPKEGKDIFIPFNDIPDLGLQYARFFRELLLQEKLLEFILPLYEQAKIQEAKDTPTLQVLDEAVLPIKRAKPKRAFFVIFWAMLSIFISSIYILLVENTKKLKETNPAQYDKISLIYHSIRDDFKMKKRHR